MPLAHFWKLLHDPGGVPPLSSLCCLEVRCSSVPLLAYRKGLGLSFPLILILKWLLCAHQVIFCKYTMWLTGRGAETILHAITSPIDGEKTKTEVLEEYPNGPESLNVSIPLEHIQLKEESEPSSFIISIPLLEYSEAHVDSLSSLMQRVHASSLTFPPGWVHVPSASNELVCQMETKAKEPVVVLTLWVAEDLSWSLMVLGRNVTMPESFPCPKHVNSIATLTAILGALLEYQVCKGNHEQAYIDLCKLQQGKFHDRTGKRQMSVTVVNMYTYIYM